MLSNEHERTPVLNLIMKVDDDDWDIPAGQTGRSSMSLSRYLEYTSDNISVIYREVNDKILNDLKTMPCLLMTEFEKGRLPDSQPHLFSKVRVATLQSVVVNGKDLDYSFKIDHDFGRVIVDNFRQLGDRLF